MRPLRTLGDMPIEWSAKSNGPPKCFIASSTRCSRSATDVASAAMTGALHLAASSLSVPMRSDTGVLVSTISAPSSTARSATFHAIDCSLSAPKMIPFFPFNRLNDIKFSFSYRTPDTKPSGVESCKTGRKGKHFFRIARFFRLFVRCSAARGASVRRRSQHRRPFEEGRSAAEKGSDVIGESICSPRSVFQPRLRQNRGVRSSRRPSGRMRHSRWLVAGSSSGPRAAM